MRLKETYRPEGCAPEQWASRAVGVVIAVSGPSARELIDIDFRELGHTASNACAMWYEVEPALDTAADDVGL